MSKERARNPESYTNEELLLAIIPTLLENKGFVRAEVKRTGQMKFIVAARAGGGAVTFWLKQGWSDTKYYSAIQFGMLPGENPAERPDSAFTDFVLARVASAKQNGASHALLVHMHEGVIKEYVALSIDDVSLAYSAQIAGWPCSMVVTKVQSTPAFVRSSAERSQSLDTAICLLFFGNNWGPSVRPANRNQASR